MWVYGVSVGCRVWLGVGYGSWDLHTHAYTNVLTRVSLCPPIPSHMQIGMTPWMLYYILKPSATNEIVPVGILKPNPTVAETSVGNSLSAGNSAQSAKPEDFSSVSPTHHPSPNILSPHPLATYPLQQVHPHTDTHSLLHRRTHTPSTRLVTRGREEGEGDMGREGETDSYGLESMGAWMPNKGFASFQVCYFLYIAVSVSFPVSVSLSLSVSLARVHSLALSPSLSCARSLS
jgi:hypothetical protein